VTLLLASGVAAGAHAAPLGLVLADLPRIESETIDVRYQAATDSFEAEGFALRLKDEGGTPFNIMGGGFSIQATIDAAGTASAGLLVITGAILGLGFDGSPSLLSASLTGFGFPDSGPGPLEFVFEVTGGDAAALFGGIGAVLGTLVSGDTGFPNGFSADFDNLGPFGGEGNAVADTAVPEPSTLLLAGLGALALGTLRSRAPRRRAAR
jgi:hypothetical protein